LEGLGGVELQVRLHVVVEEAARPREQALLGLPLPFAIVLLVEDEVQALDLIGEREKEEKVEPGNASGRMDRSMHRHSWPPIQRHPSHPHRADTYIHTLWTTSTRARACFTRLLSFWNFKRFFPPEVLSARTILLLSLPGRRHPRC